MKVTERVTSDLSYLFCIHHSSTAIMATNRAATNPSIGNQLMSVCVAMRREEGKEEEEVVVKFYLIQARQYLLLHLEKRQARILIPLTPQVMTRLLIKFELAVSFRRGCSVYLEHV